MPKLRIEVELNVSDRVLPEAEKSEYVESVRRQAVLDLLRRGRVTQSRAAELLEVSRAELFDMMAEASISQMDLQPGEVERDAAQAAELFRRTRP